MNLDQDKKKNISPVLEFVMLTYEICSHLLTRISIGNYGILKSGAVEQRDRCLNPSVLCAIDVGTGVSTCSRLNY